MVLTEYPPIPPSPLSPPAGRLLPAGRGRLGAGGPDGLQGDRGSQPAAVHGRLRHPGFGRHAVPAGLPGLLWGHQGEQVSPALCESNMFYPPPKCSHLTLNKTRKT